MNDKIKVVFTGHVDHGKSTLIGRLLYDTSSIPTDKIKDMQSQKSVQKNLDFAFLMDHFEEERNQGITIETTQIFFRSKKNEYVIIDAPGHVEFVKNMITGAAQADVAVLIIDANDGIQEQTKRHSYILSLLGIKKIILAINKMDLVEYCEKTFHKIVSDISCFLKRIGIVHCVAIPISATEGDNITDKSKKMEWYNGKSLLELFDDIEMNSSIDKEEVVFSVQDVYNIENENKKTRIIVGKVESGRLITNQKITLLPSNQSAKLEYIKKYNEQCECSEVGECVGLIIDKPLFVERGNIVVGEKTNLKKTTNFKAIIFWMNNDEGNILKKFKLKCCTQEVTCQIKTINRKFDSSTLEEIEDKRSIKKLEVCEIEIHTKTPLIINDSKKIIALSRFVLTTNDNIVASGIITEI